MTMACRIMSTLSAPFYCAVVSSRVLIRRTGSRIARRCTRQALLDCGVGIDGGKDSLSMAARCGDELVKSPGTLVMTVRLFCTHLLREHAQYLL